MTSSLFKQRVLEIVRTIPCGQTMSYAQVATQAGNPHAYRAVGNIMARNYDPTIPCHRVVRSDGTFGGYNRGRETKQRLLAEEKSL